MWEMATAIAAIALNAWIDTRPCFSYNDRPRTSSAGAVYRENLRKSPGVRVDVEAIEGMESDAVPRWRAGVKSRCRQHHGSAIDRSTVLVRQRDLDGPAATPRTAGMPIAARTWQVTNMIDLRRTHKKMLPKRRHLSIVDAITGGHHEMRPPDFLTFLLGEQCGIASFTHGWSRFAVSPHSSSSCITRPARPE
jgi:hypothetical protein